MLNQKCITCNNSFKGRIDKKYCSDYCRNTYNNSVNKDAKNLIRNTNNRLRKNYKVLTELNKTGKIKVTRSKLISRNFDFNFFTQIYTTKTGNVYYYTYDQGYLELDNEIYLLIKRD
ncbi:MAG: hypothetical protein L3J23_03285 [Flavobacteriaceae bacterium]|nr:hypothetical protein [Flavobacteriaceae bacterium]